MPHPAAEERIRVLRFRESAQNATSLSLHLERQWIQLRIRLLLHFVWRGISGDRNVACRPYSVGLFSRLNLQLNRLGATAGFLSKIVQMYIKTLFVDVLCEVKKRFTIVFHRKGPFLNPVRKKFFRNLSSELLRSTFTLSRKIRMKILFLKAYHLILNFRICKRY